MVKCTAQKAVILLEKAIIANQINAIKKEQLIEAGRYIFQT